MRNKHLPENVESDPVAQSTGRMAVMAMIPANATCLLPSKNKINSAPPANPMYDVLAPLVISKHRAIKKMIPQKNRQRPRRRIDRATRAAIAPYRPTPVGHHAPPVRLYQDWPLNAALSSHLNQEAGERIKLPRSSSHRANTNNKKIATERRSQL